MESQVVTQGSRREASDGRQHQLLVASTGLPPFVNFTYWHLGSSNRVRRPSNQPRGFKAAALTARYGMATKMLVCANSEK